MVPHALAALHQAEIPHQAITPAAHAGQATAFEQSEHAAMMHRPVIPSILDGSRILLAPKIRHANKRSTDQRDGIPILLCSTRSEAAIQPIRRPAIVPCGYRTSPSLRRAFSRAAIGTPPHWGHWRAS